MKNKIFITILLLFFNNLIFDNSFAKEDFEFNITEIEITDSGNIYKGYKRGTISTKDGVVIKADKFTYNKKTNVILAQGSVEFNDKVKDYKIFSNEIEYKKDSEEIFSIGPTKFLIESKYIFNSSNILFLKDKMQLSSNNFSQLNDNNSNTFEFENFIYFLNEELLKAKKIKINLYKENKDEFDTIYLTSGFFNLKETTYLAENTEIYLHKNIFDKNENEPRLLGASSNLKNNITTINKGIFTSCKKTDNCPPWSIKAEKIKHDKFKKKLIYDNAILRVYDFPVLYFPKFFHPDPSVKRQSGFLKPQLNSSDILGSSLYIPYFNAISENEDYTFKPTFFKKNIIMLANEYRFKGPKSSFIADFSYLNGYQSSQPNKKNSISHFFSNFNLDLALEKFNNSNIAINLEKTTNDTYLKVFDNNFDDQGLKPNNYDVLSSGLSFYLDHNKFNFSSGLNIYEDLQKINNDRYQYVFPYYDLKTNLDLLDFSISLHSRGSNTLYDTNILKTNIINDLSYSNSFFTSEYGLNNNFGIYLKNINTLSKNDALYKNSPQSEISSLIEFNSSIPLIKENEKNQELLTPLLSFRINPNDMKNYSTTARAISINNLFDINRLGLDDTFEEGKSITVGLNYTNTKKEKNKLSNNYSEFKLGTVFRDKNQDRIPITSTLNKKQSHIFGGYTNSNFDNIKLNYNFTLNNNLKMIDYQQIGANLSINNLITEFNFIEENRVIGSSNILENITSYSKDDKNFLSFSTRRNREINLTEYYNLIYEYKNDCLTAGIKYKKTYYEDRDVKPSEDLLFTITFFPLTTYEQEIN